MNRSHTRHIFLLVEPVKEVRWSVGIRVKGCTETRPGARSGEAEIGRHVYDAHSPTPGVHHAEDIRVQHAQPHRPKAPHRDPEQASAGRLRQGAVRAIHVVDEIPGDEVLPVARHRSVGVVAATDGIIHIRSHQDHWLNRPIPPQAVDCLLEHTVPRANARRMAVQDVDDRVAPVGLVIAGRQIDAHLAVGGRAQQALLQGRSVHDPVDDQRLEGPGVRVTRQNGVDAEVQQIPEVHCGIPLRSGFGSLSARRSSLDDAHSPRRPRLEAKPSCWVPLPPVQRQPCWHGPGRWGGFLRLTAAAVAYAPSPDHLPAGGTGTSRWPGLFLHRPGHPT